jgi:NTP pyrophosphatase (non-canonical NTP hydrolase)
MARSTQQPSADGFTELRDSLRSFAQERDWDQFHSPRNLAVALVIEATELLEHFQWLTDEQSRDLSRETINEIRLEMADVLLYLIRLADRLEVDLIQAAREKITINAEKYPVHKARGSNRKYNKL